MDQQTTKQKLRSVLRWVGWVILVQFILLNISAAFYAHKFTRFYAEVKDTDIDPNENVIKKTWRLFAGQKLPRPLVVDYPAFSFDTIQLKTKKGLPISAWYAQADSAAKGTVVLFHGLTSTKGKMLLEASEFRHLGYNVMLVDFRGHGNSGGFTTTMGYRESEEVKLAFDFLQQKGEKKIYLWGTSMGAVCIMKAISDYDLQPTAVMLEMPFASLQTYLRSRARAIGFAGFPEKPFGLLVSAWIGIERGFNGLGFVTTKYAEKVKCPVLYQWGRQDHIVLSYETDKVYKAIASPNKRLVVYEQADHESFLQKEPEKWRSEISTFLGNTPK